MRIFCTLQDQNLLTSILGCWWKTEQRSFPLLPRFGDTKKRLPKRGGKKHGLIKKELDGVKVLGNGTLEKAITVKAHKFSKSALAAIEAAGGKTEVI